MVINREERIANSLQYLRSSRFLLVVLFLVALLVRLIGVNTTLVGDQLASLQEADKLGTNLQGLPYFVLLKLFMAFSRDMLWMRLPSILMGSLTIPVCWLWLQSWRGTFVATSTSLLLSLSPLAIEHSQQIRFYALFLFAVILFFWAYTRILLYPQNVKRNDLIYLGLSTILLSFSHLLGIVVIFFTLIHWAICNSYRVPCWIWTILGLSVFFSLTLVFTAILFPSIFQSMYQTFMRIIASKLQDYTSPRGWSLIIPAKGAWISFNMLFGQYVYPFDLIIVVPGALSALLLVTIGLINLFREKTWNTFYFFLIIGFLSVVTILVIFEPLVPTSFIATTSARHVIWILPLFLWLISEGLKTISNLYLRQMLIVVLVIVEIVGTFYFYNSNNNLDAAINNLSRLNSNTQDAIFFVDGRANDMLKFYLNNTLKIRSLWDYEEVGNKTIFQPDNHSRVAVMTLEEKDTQRCQHSQFLAQMANYPVVFSDVKYPLFTYVYDTISTLPTGVPALPQTVFHPRFQDLVLPQEIDWHGYPNPIIGVYTLPDCIGKTLWQYTFQKPVEGKSLLFLSNIITRLPIRDGETVGQLDLVTQQNKAISFPIRKGYETQTWDGVCSNGCDSVLTWSKQFQLLGFSAFPGAYDRFQAHIWGIDLPLKSEAIKSLTIKMINANVELNIWGLMVAP